MQNDMRGYGRIQQPPHIEVFQKKLSMEIKKET